MDRLPLQHSIRDALGGRYHVRHEIGHGAMATVFLAEAQGTGDTVAVKVLHPELAAAVGPERFHREIEILSRLRHPRIVPVLDSDEAGGLLFLVMPHVAGENLRSRLEREGQLPTSVALAIAGESARRSTTRTARTSSTATSSRRTSCWRASGRWSATSAWRGRSTGPRWSRSHRAGWCLARPAYMSPEQAMGQREPRARVRHLRARVRGVRDADRRAAVHGPDAAGADRPAVDRAAPAMRTVRPDLPAPIEAAVLAALAKDPSPNARGAARISSRG